MTRAYAGARACIALGSNLGDPVRQVREAAHALDALPASRRLAMSSLYVSAPLGGMAQPDYINAVAILRTRLPPLDLLHHLQEIERRQGRVRSGRRWEARTLDLDLLLYDDLRLRDTELTLPHPGLAQRNFVLYPLFEIAPDLDIPGLGALRELVSKSSMEGLQRMEHTHETQAS
ncbi:MAG TPA: 2-amino-4-hydroxy-6-hydroxymethyldihydropteridine diphosphokinase [Gammaproteobacteria bacterium]|nr:2-amino-4-hydroxy-6-hydroxymethyldihydropteridine diphosphokinase [Gammaproteobacteria bacterium]